MILNQRLVPPCSFEGVALSAPHSVLDYRNINTTYCPSDFLCHMVSEVGYVFWKINLANSDHHTSLTKVIVSTEGQTTLTPPT